MKTLSTAIIAGVIAVTSSAAFAGTTLIRTPGPNGYTDVVDVFDGGNAVVEGRSASADYSMTAGDYLTSEVSGRGSSLVRDTASFAIDGRSASVALDAAAGDYLSGSSRF